MAKKNLNLDKLDLGKKRSVVKKDQVSTEPEEKIEEAVASIHTAAETEEPPAEKKEVKSKASNTRRKKEPPKEVETKRVTIDIPSDLHKQLKVRGVMEGFSIKDYFLDLLVKDMAKHSR